jgi:hypothetical protein
MPAREADRSGRARPRRSPDPGGAVSILEPRGSTRDRGGTRAAGEHGAARDPRRRGRARSEPSPLEAETGASAAEDPTEFEPATRGEGAEERRAPRQHTRPHTYGCSVPGLTRFVSSRCVGPAPLPHPPPIIRACRSRIESAPGVRGLGGKKVAEREGFEPSIRFPVYTLSKRAPSATRTPLRGGALELRASSAFARRPRG